MAHRILIQFAAPADIHRIRNFGEALRRSLPEIDGRLSLAEIDIAVDRLDVTHIHTRKLKRVLAHIETLLAEHHLTAGLSTDRSLHRLLPTPVSN